MTKQKVSDRVLTTLFKQRADRGTFQAAAENLIEKLPGLDQETLVNIATRALRELAMATDYIDQMTAITNRKGLMEFLTKVHKKSMQDWSAPYSVLFIDADHFKNVNDTYGHEVGDNVLKALSATIKTIVGDRGLVSRMGGEEMAVVLPNIAMGPAAAIGEDVRRAVATMHEIYGTPPATVSLGVARYRAGSTPKEIFDAADKALYKAKHNGRNQVVKSEIPETPVSPDLAETIYQTYEYKR